MKENLVGKSPVELFELFFSKEMKDHILEASEENGLRIDLEDLDQFVGISIFSASNARKSFRDYWSTDELLHCDAVSKIMSRNKFLDIKSKLKTSKIADKNEFDKLSKVRKILNLKKNTLPTS